MKKILSNFIYQGVFQITKILLPLITIPIVSNALGPQGIGTFNYTNSIVQYFVLFTGLGIGVYGNKEIAINRDDKLRLSKTFWELFLMSFIISLCTFLVYLIFLPFFPYHFYFVIQILIIIGCAFDISWFFMGIENFRLSSISSLITQIISFLCIVLFIKDENDLWIYIFIQSINLLIPQIIMWIFIKKFIVFKRVSLKSAFKHFKPSLYYFVPKIAIILYTTLTKTLLGILGSTSEVGFYTNSLMLNSILVTLITTADLVLLPRMSNMVSKGDKTKIIKVLKMTTNLQLYLTIPITIGIILISPSLVPWFFGEKFLQLIYLIPLTTPLLIIMPLGMSVGRQYLVPFNRIKTYNMAVFNGAIASIILNLLLIPKIGVYGALASTLVAELLVTITRTRTLVKETDFAFDILLLFKIILSSVIMYLVSYYATINLSNGGLKLVVQVITGAIIYFTLTTCMKSNVVLSIYKNYKK